MSSSAIFGDAGSRAAIRCMVCGAMVEAIAITLPSRAPASTPLLAEDHGFDLLVEADHDDDEVARRRDRLRRQRGLNAGFGGGLDRVLGNVEAGDREAALHQVARHRQAHLAEPDQADAADVLLCHGISSLG